jgi:photosystem II stability/assembly factor-like uncharacterized protein
MDTAGTPQVQFMDGAAGDDVVPIWVACDLLAGNFDHTRLCYMDNNEEWFHLDVPFTVVSVLALSSGTPPTRQVFALGRNGQVWIAVSGGTPLIERIPDAGLGRAKYGYLSQIRAIAGGIYVCGDQGQVYRRRNNSWIHIDAGLLHPYREEGPDNGLNGIDGTSSQDIYVVGDAGMIFHFDGTHWADAGITSNVDLERIRCIDPDTVYVCGEAGTLIRGNRNGWTLLAEGNVDDHLWDLEMFNGTLYLAGDSGLLALIDDALVPVSTGLIPLPDAHRLSSNGRELWSIGENHLVRFDGLGWREVVHPDNR